MQNHFLILSLAYLTQSLYKAVKPPVFGMPKIVTNKCWIKILADYHKSNSLKHYEFYNFRQLMLIDQLLLMLLIFSYGSL